MEKNKEVANIYILLFICHIIAATCAIQETKRISPVRVPAAIIAANVNGECPSVAAFFSVRGGLSLLQVPECGIGQWIEVTNFDMANSSNTCPTPWTEVSLPSRSCSSSNCTSSVKFTVSSPSFTRVCGRVTGYATGSVDAFSHYALSNTSAGDGSLDGIYLDGVSITHGFPRSHIWSFGAGHGVGGYGGSSRCPCDNQNRILPPSFVGDNYFCDGEYNGALWDGQNCTTSCCLFHSPPWFKVSLPAPTSDAIEVRICTDQQSRNERVFIGALKIFVQ